MAQNLGTIYYEVDADTKKLVESEKDVNKSLGKVTKTMAETDAQAGKLGTKMTATASAVKNLGKESAAASSSIGGVSKVLAGLVTLQGVKQLSDMADGWTNLQNRLRLVTKSQEELNQATQAVFSIAQATSQSMDTVAEVYQRFAQNASTLGISLAEVAEVTETVSKAVAVSGASAGAAQAALTQFGQALASGTLRGEELNSIMEQTPALAAAIAKGLGITTGELRTMGAAGEITAQKLIGALQAASGSVNEQFSTRIKTVQSAFVELGNGLTKFVGEASSSTGASAALAEGISMVAQNIDVLANALTAAGAGALAFYIAKMGASAVASAAATIAARSQAMAELQLATANMESATAAALNAQRMAQLTGSHTAATAAANAQAAAETRLALAQRAVTSIGGTLLGVLGGPVGLVALAATAATSMYLFSGNSDKAASSLVDMTRPLDEVTKKFKELSASQRELTLAATQADMAKGIRDLDKAYADLARGSMAEGTKAAAKFRNETGDQIKGLVEGARTGRISYQELDNQLIRIIKTYADANGKSAEWVNEQVRLASEVSTSAVRLQNAQQQSKALTDANNGLATANRNAAAGQRELNLALSGGNTDAGKYLKSIQDRVAGLQDGNSAVKAAQRFLLDHTEATEGDRVAIMSAAQAADYLAKQQAAVKSGLKDSAAAAKENAKAIADMKQDLREAALAGDELAVVKARARLNTFASPSEIKQVEELARAMYKLSQDAETKATVLENEKAIGQLSVALGMAALKGRELAVAQAQLALNPLATPEQVAQAQQIAAATWDLADAEAKRQAIQGTDQGQAAKKAFDYVRGDVDPLKGGEFDQQQARYAAEAKAEQERYIAQQERLKEAMALGIEIKNGYWVTEEQLAKEHADRMAQIEQARNSLMLKAGEQGFGAVAGAMKAAFGEQNALYKAAFIAQKGFAIAQSVIAIQQGLALAAANPFPANLAAMASVAAATAGLVSSISSVTMGGGRQYGGPVAPGAMHRINENGKPEILNAANGQQFLLPNTRGQVVSSGDAQGSGAPIPSVVVNLIEDRSRAGQVDTNQTAQGTEVNAFVADIRGHGKRAEALETTYGLKRVGQ